MPDTLQSTYAAQNIEQTVALHDPFTLERYHQFAKSLPIIEGTVLDVGCAEGVGGPALKSIKPNFRITGLDCVADRIDNLPPCYESSIIGLTTSIPAEDRVFDAIIAGEFIEHLYPSDVDTTLCEFNRILKIGGYLAMTTPNPYSLKMRLQHGTVYGTAHLTQHYPEVLKMRLKFHGFSQIKLLGSGKASRILGQHFPWLSVYGSYMIVAKKY